MKEMEMEMKKMGSEIGSSSHHVLLYPQELSVVSYLSIYLFSETRAERHTHRYTGNGWCVSELMGAGTRKINLRV